MDFTLSPEHEKLRIELRDFTDIELILLEKDTNINNDNENISRDAVKVFRQKAKYRRL